MTKDLALLLLRLTGIGLALGHGWGKIVALSSGNERFVQSVSNLGFPAPGLFAWAAGLSEFLGGICVAIGLGARIAAGFAACTMFVAAFLRHHAHLQLMSQLGLLELSQETLKAWGNPESALVYLAVMLAVVLAGPGRFALDSLFGKRR